MAGPSPNVSTPTSSQSISLTDEEQKDYDEFLKQYNAFDSPMLVKISSALKKPRSGGFSLFDDIQKILESHGIKHLSGEKFIAVFQHRETKTPTPAPEPKANEKPTTAATYTGNLASWAGAYNVVEPDNFAWNTLNISKSTGYVKLSKGSDSKEYQKVSATVDDTGVWYTFGDQSTELYKVQASHSTGGSDPQPVITVSGSVRKQKTTVSSGTSSQPASAPTGTPASKAETPSDGATPQTGTDQASKQPTAGAPSNAASNDYTETTFKAQLSTSESDWEKFKKNGGLGYCYVGLVTLAMLLYGIYKMKQTNNATNEARLTREALERIAERLGANMDQLERNIGADAVENLLVRSGSSSSRSRFSETVSSVVAEANRQLTEEIRLANEQVDRRNEEAAANENGHPPVDNSLPVDEPAPENRSKTEKTIPKEREIELTALKHPLTYTDVLKHSSTDVVGTLRNVARDYVRDQASPAAEALGRAYDSAGVNIARFGGPADANGQDFNADLKPVHERAFDFVAKEAATQMQTPDGFMRKSLEGTVTKQEGENIEELRRQGLEVHDGYLKSLKDLNRLLKDVEPGSLGAGGIPEAMDRMNKLIEKNKEALQDLSDGAERAATNMKEGEEGVKREREEFENGSSTIEPRPDPQPRPDPRAAEHGVGK